MSDFTCAGIPAGWFNGWLAAVGATVLEPRIRLKWTEDGARAVLSVADCDPIAVLVESWPDTALLSDLPVADDWRGSGRMRRHVPVEAFAERIRAARGHRYSWTLSSTMTDLSVNKDGEAAHAPLDPAGPGTIKWLHHRLMKAHKHVENPSVERIRESLTGVAPRVKDNGLGFDQTRLGSLSDNTDPWTDPVVEVLAFYGLAILPVRARGVDDRLEKSADRGEVRQRGWRKSPSTDGARRFYWPAWGQPLDAFGIDALLDAWNPNRKSAWLRLGIHAGWRSVRYQSKSSSDPTRAFGPERL